MHIWGGRGLLSPGHAGLLFGCRGMRPAAGVREMQEVLKERLERIDWLWPTLEEFVFLGLWYWTPEVKWRSWN